MDSAATIREAGLRATVQRVALLRVLTGMAAPAPVDVLVRRGKGAYDTATAYRMLDAFTAAGLARRIELARGRALYERAGRHHHHAVCRSCGRIADVDACVPKSLNKGARTASGFAQIDDHVLEFFGICDRCA